MNPYLILRRIRHQNRPNGLSIHGQQVTSLNPRHKRLIRRHNLQRHSSVVPKRVFRLLRVRPHKNLTSSIRIRPNTNLNVIRRLIIPITPPRAHRVIPRHYNKVTRHHVIIRPSNTITLKRFLPIKPVGRQSVNGSQSIPTRNLVSLRLPHNINRIIITPSRIHRIRIIIIRRRHIRMNKHSVQTRRGRIIGLIITGSRVPLRNVTSRHLTNTQYTRTSNGKHIKATYKINIPPQTSGNLIKIPNPPHLYLNQH